MKRKIEGHSRSFFLAVVFSFLAVPVFSSGCVWYGFNYNWTQVSGNGDTILDPGESWNFDLALRSESECDVDVLLHLYSNIAEVQKAGAGSNSARFSLSQMPD